MNIIINSTLEFNENLMKALCETDSEEEEDLCLISGDPLETLAVQLACKHKFNYGAILNEIKIQKKPSTLEVKRLKTYQIKCPYCRCIQNGVLPWRPGYPQLQGINYPVSKTYKAFYCNSILKSGTRKGLLCGKNSVEKYCPRHMRLKKKAKDIAKAVNNPTIGTPQAFLGCSAVLKSGKRKGHKCGATIKFYSTHPDQNISTKIGYCGRHYNSNKIKPEPAANNVLKIPAYHPNTGTNIEWSKINIPINTAMNDPIPLLN